MKLEVTFPDAELLTKDLLADLIAPHEPDVTVAIGVPRDWTPESPAHLQVISDGTPIVVSPILAQATIRVLARAAATSEAKRLAALAQGLLAAHEGGAGISGIKPLTGVLAAQDPDTHAELAAVTQRVTVRSNAITPASI